MLLYALLCPIPRVLGLTGGKVPESAVSHSVARTPFLGVAAHSGLLCQRGNLAR